MTPRDSQRQKVYDAERRAFKDAPIDLPEMEDIERFVAHVRTLKRVRQSFPCLVLRPVQAKDGRARRAAGGNSQGIFMPRWSRKKWIVLHELSHTIVQRVHGVFGAAGHGWEFASAYLTLVRHVLGRGAHDALKAEFRAGRVRFKAPRKRAPLSAERRAALAQMLVKARASRYPVSAVGASAPASSPTMEKQ